MRTRPVTTPYERIARVAAHEHHGVGLVGAAGRERGDLRNRLLGQRRETGCCAR